MADFRSIVYTSTAKWLLSHEELEALLIEARRLNLENGITGVLLYCDGNFMQCFSGRKAVLPATYERIKASRKHKNIIELMDEEADAPDFPDWLMGFGEPTKSVWLGLSTAHWGVMEKYPEETYSRSVGFQLLQKFWENNSRR